MHEDPPNGSQRRESSAVAVGMAATAARLGAGVASASLRPARALGRAVLGRPAFRGRVDALASAGRDAEADGRRRLEEAANRVLTAPESARTLDRALAGPVPEALTEETIERLGRRVVDSPAFERLLREALESPDVQRALEDVMSGPVVRNVVARQSRTLWDDVAARVRATTERVDDATELRVGRALRRPAPIAETRRYAGLASRGAAFAVDLALAHLAVLLAEAGVAVLAWLFDVESRWVLGPIAAAGWLVLVGGYFVFFWSTTGQTPGMRALGLRVIAPEGGPPRARRALVRFVVGVVTLAPLFAGLLPVPVDRRRRAVHDFAARTVVVHDALVDLYTGGGAGASSAASTS